ncbi:hypothetical protein DIPPA_18439 [Diplonema papillatum]|nr:hypothetical protein DIPPA_18439 [Diplonema papillatum]|eukprot:gene3580-5557_t
MTEFSLAGRRKRIRAAARDAILRQGEEGGASVAASDEDDIVAQVHAVVCPDVDSAVGMADEKQVLLTRHFLAIWNGKEGPEACMKRAGVLQVFFSAMQLVFCSVAFVFAGLSSHEDKTGESLFADIFFAILGFLSALLGVYSGAANSEFFARLFFVCQMWMLNSVTLYLYIEFDKEQVQASLCSPSVGSRSDLSACHGRLAVHRAKVSFAVLTAAVSIATAFLSLNLNDAINDYDALRPIVHANHAAELQVNRNFPNHLAYDKPKDRRADVHWHLRYKQSKTAPDVDRAFFGIKIG